MAVRSSFETASIVTKSESSLSDSKELIFTRMIAEETELSPRILARKKNDHMLRWCPR